MSQPPLKSFSDTSIRNLPNPPVGTIWSYKDSTTRGLYLEVSNSKKVFRFRKHVPSVGKQRNLRIGEFGPLNVSKARARAGELLFLVETGKDPLEEEKKKKREKEATQKLGMTLREARDELVSDKLGGTIKSTTAEKFYQKELDYYAKDLLDVPISELSTDLISRHVKALLSTPAKGSRHTSVGIWLRTLSSVLNHANLKANGKLFEKNPVIGVRSLGMLKKSKPKERRLLEHEYPIFFKYLYEKSSFVSTMPSVTADFLLFVLFTGVRRGEGSQLLWSDVKLSSGASVATIRATKTDSLRTIPLSPFLETLLFKRFAAKKGPYVFEGSGKQGCIAEPKNLLVRFFESKEAKENGVEKFSVHDLRRTFSSEAKSVVDSMIVSRLTGHATKSVEGLHYSSIDMRQLREGMEKITQRLLHVCKGETT